LKKEKIILADDRYLIYYKFGKDKSKAQVPSDASKAKVKGGKR
jgi:hypothetical protein